MKIHPFIVGIIVAALALLGVTVAGATANASETPADPSIVSYKSF
jgi:hypothetical protein